MTQNETAFTLTITDGRIKIEADVDIEGAKKLIRILQAHIAGLEHKEGALTTWHGPQQKYLTDNWRKTQRGLHDT